LGHIDEIIVLHKGRIAEHGTYEELKYAGGLFAYLLAEQNRYNLDRREDQAPRRPASRPADVGPHSASSPNGRGRQPRVQILKGRGILVRVRTRPKGSVAANHSTDRSRNGSAP
jgi:ABC-type multidrug transport system ATPase subunit